MPAFWRHVCIAANSAAVGRGICRLTWICWPPALIFATIFGTVPDWCTAASTRPLETDATPSTFAIWAAVRLRERQLRAGQEEVVDELVAGLAELREIGDHRLIGLDHLAPAAEAAAAEARRPATRPASAARASP